MPFKKPKNAIVLPWLRETPSWFPDVNQALIKPDGLVAAGGDLSEKRLIYAYKKGIFPWYNPGEPILWWSPSKRAVLRPQNIYISRRLKRIAKKGHIRVTFNQGFENIIKLCAAPRLRQSGTWITPEMQHAYIQLHKHGYAHSIEVYYEDELVGGLYGVSIGKVFYAESMFSKKSNASKFALIALCQQLQRWGFPIIDCQFQAYHLKKLGAEEIDRATFIEQVHKSTYHKPNHTKWQFDEDIASLSSIE